MRVRDARPLVGASLGALLLAACGPLIPENPPPRCEELACTVEVDEGLRTVVDASSSDEWVALSLDTGAVVDDETWDLRFQRYQVRTNGGSSGEGGVEVAILDEADFLELEQAPDAEWVVDSDELGENDEPQYAFSQDGGWYEYDLATHRLSPRADRVYVVKTVGERYFKLRMDGYYDDDGNAGHPSFTWSAVAAP